MSCQNCTCDGKAFLALRDEHIKRLNDIYCQEYNTRAHRAREIIAIYAPNYPLFGQRRSIYWESRPDYQQIQNEYTLLEKWHNAKADEIHAWYTRRMCNRGSEEPLPMFDDIPVDRIANATGIL